VTYIVDPGNVAGYSYTDAAVRRWKDTSGLWRTDKLASDATAAAALAKTLTVVTQAIALPRLGTNPFPITEYVADYTVPLTGFYMNMFSGPFVIQPGTPAGAVIQLMFEVATGQTSQSLATMDGTTDGASGWMGMYDGPRLVTVGQHIRIFGCRGTNAATTVSGTMYVVFVPTPGYPH
jgi:hypothetical protein